MSATGRKATCMTCGKDTDTTETAPRIRQKCESDACMGTEQIHFTGTATNKQENLDDFATKKR